MWLQECHGTRSPKTHWFDKNSGSSSPWWNETATNLYMTSCKCKRRQQTRANCSKLLQTAANSCKLGQSPLQTANNLQTIANVAVIMSVCLLQYEWNQLMHFWNAVTQSLVVAVLQNVWSLQLLVPWQSYNHKLYQ